MKLRRFLSACALVVVLTPNGFEPKELTVPAGETVTFQTTRGKYFWPASNEHPTHGVYPEFDPKRPIDPDSEWTFRFDKAGIWSFHDHISPYFTGVIHVSEQGEQVVEEKEDIWSKIKDIKAYMNTFFVHNLIFIDYTECKRSELTRSERVQCWEKIVVAVLQKKGLHAALRFVDRQKNRDTAFSADCHIYVHRIGEEYYWKFFDKGNIEVSDKFELCDRGFFHGFMQEFTSHGENIAEAKRYCDVLISHMSGDERAENFLLQCYHGIGHGLAFMYAPEHWGNNEEIMRRGITDCGDMFSGDPRFCISGVYGGMAAMHWGLHGFTLAMDASEPFALCKNQPLSIREDCLDQLVPVLFGEMDMDLVKAGRFIEKLHADEEVLEVLMEHLGSMPAYTLVPSTDDYTLIVHACRMFESPLHESCLRGFVRRLVLIGPPKESIRRHKKFCESTVLSEVERSICLAK